MKETKEIAYGTLSPRNQVCTETKQNNKKKLQRTQKNSLIRRYFVVDQQERYWISAMQIPRLINITDSLYVLPKIEAFS